MTAAYTYTYGEGPATELSITALNSEHAVATIPITTYFSSGESIDSTLYVNENVDSLRPDLPERFLGYARHSGRVPLVVPL